MGKPIVMHAQVHGDRGPPVLILHGLLGSQRNWRSVSRSLAQGHRVFTADLRNHGLSPHSPNMGYPDLTADVAALIRDLGVGAVRLVGHSLGAKVAMCVALAEPEWVETLVAVDMAPVAYPDRNTPILRALRGLPLGELRDRAAADRKLAETISEPPLRQFLLTNLVQTADGFAWLPNLSALAAASQALSGFPEFGPETAFPGPALFIHGRSSPYRVPDHRNAIDTLFPAARLLEITDAGHWPHIESPERFLGALRDFFCTP